LDSILMEKAKTARAKGVEFKAFVDFREGGFINPMDLSSIFGNALDNAIEAASRVEDPKRRLLSLKAASQSGVLAVKVVNCFDPEKHPLKKDGEQLLSTKEDPREHGIGIRSMRYSVEKYGGMLDFGVEDLYYFVLNLVLPIPPTKE